MGSRWDFHNDERRRAVQGLVRYVRALNFEPWGGRGLPNPRSAQGVREDRRLHRRHHPGMVLGRSCAFLRHWDPLLPGLPAQEQPAKPAYCHGTITGHLRSSTRLMVCMSMWWAWGRGLAYVLNEDGLCPRTSRTNTVLQTLWLRCATSTAIYLVDLSPR